MTTAPWTVEHDERPRYGSGGYVQVVAHVPAAPVHEWNVLKVCHEDWPLAPADLRAVLALRNLASSLLAVIEALIQGDALEAMRIRHDASCVEGPCCCEVDIQRAAVALDAFRAAVREEKERGVPSEGDRNG